LEAFYPGVGLASLRHDPATKESGFMALVDVKVFYLEMLAHAEQTIPAPRDGLTVVHARRPTIGYYRFLYDSVGRNYHWRSRKRLSDADLAVILNDPLNEVHVLHVEGTPAGFAELDRRIAGEIELTQFGLVPEFIGQGLGRWFLQWTVYKARSFQPGRFWLHTCTLDHPAALPNYQKAGFTVYKEETIRRDI
jgi:GNAT superfamily N-acetyltransferase